MKDKEKKRDKKAPIRVPPKFNGKTPPAYMDVGMGNLSVGRDILLSNGDPNGSYTGISRDADDRPVQDADDL